MMEVELMLADHAEVVNGKHYILGGGWTITTGDAPFAIAVTAQIPWDEAGLEQALTLELVNEDGGPPLINGQEFRVDSTFTPERVDEAAPGTPFDARLALTLSALPLVKGRRYTLIARSGDTVLAGKDFLVRAA